MIGKCFVDAVFGIAFVITAVNRLQIIQEYFYSGNQGLELHTWKFGSFIRFRTFGTEVFDNVLQPYRKLAGTHMKSVRQIKEGPKTLPEQSVQYSNWDNGPLRLPMRNLTFATSCCFNSYVFSTVVDPILFCRNFIRRMSLFGTLSFIGSASSGKAIYHRRRRQEGLRRRQTRSCYGTTWERTWTASTIFYRPRFIRLQLFRKKGLSKLAATPKRHTRRSSWHTPSVFGKRRYRQTTIDLRMMDGSRMDHRS